LEVQNGNSGQSGATRYWPAPRDAVKQWLYPPQKLETLVEVDVPFKLPNDNPPSQQ
jgi:hypothetical protein